jgi:hypothetical protein
MMNRWEYDKLDLNDLPRKTDEVDVLNEAGKGGWELVALTANNVAILKRVVAQEPAPAKSTSRRATTSRALAKWIATIPQISLNRFAISFEQFVMKRLKIVRNRTKVYACVKKFSRVLVWRKIALRIFEISQRVANEPIGHSLQYCGINVHGKSPIERTLTVPLS